MATDECDTVYQAGLRAAEEIRRSMQVLGRRRRIAESARAAKPSNIGARSAAATDQRPRPPPQPQPQLQPRPPQPGPTHNAAPTAGPPVADEEKDNPNCVNCVNMLYFEDVPYCVTISEGATPYSSFCRRRSVRIAGSPDTFAAEVHRGSSCSEPVSDSILNLMPFGPSRNRVEQ